jgi:hypothetical protein
MFPVEISWALPWENMKRIPAIRRVMFFINEE